MSVSELERVTQMIDNKRLRVAESERGTARLETASGIEKLKTTTMATRWTPVRFSNPNC